MTPEEFKERLISHKNEIRELIRNKAPRIVGVKALNFYKENYRKGGYLDRGFHSWKITARQRLGGKYAASKYGPLLSARNRMFSEIKYSVGDASVHIYNYTPYASVHNDGGVVTPTVTRQMRKYFWAMYYKNGGKKSVEAERYKWLALTKKSKLEIKIPQRKFIYDSYEVRVMVHSILKDEVKKILIG